MEGLRISLEVRRNAYTARADGKLEEFLEDFSMDTQNEIRRAITPGVAYLRPDASVVTKAPLLSKNDPQESAATWTAHKDWISNGPYALPDQAVAQISESTRDICAAINASARCYNFHWGPGVDRSSGHASVGIAHWAMQLFLKANRCIFNSPHVVIQHARTPNMSTSRVGEQCDLFLLEIQINIY